MMFQEKQSYRQVFKSTSIFGGVQVFNIIIGLVRSKIVSVLLGASGYGIMNLFNAPLSFIESLTGLGINYSAIRDISAANQTEDYIKLSTTLKVFRRWVWITGLFGMFTVIILSQCLSKWSFGNKEYTWAFLLLSITLLIGSVSKGQSAILRGTRRIKDTAKAGLLGSALGLIIAVPLYYYFGIKGIIPSLILSALIILFFSWYFSKKVKTICVKISNREIAVQGKVMIKLGLVMTLASLIGSGASYIVIAFIRKVGGVSEVGLFNAGWSITNQYSGLVFAAMGADYYPRLAGIHTDNLKIREIVNHQAEIAILIIAPMMLFYLTSLPILIPLLFTKEFLSIIPFTQWVVLGMLFKTASWTLGYISFAKGDSMVFLFLEGILGNMLQIVGYVGGYFYFGLEGIGIGFFLVNVLFFPIIVFICKKRYAVNFTKSFSRIFIIQLLFCSISFSIVYFLKYPIGYISGVIMLIFSIFYSYKSLNNRIDIKGMIRSKIKKRE